MSHYFMSSRISWSRNKMIHIIMKRKRTKDINCLMRFWNNGNRSHNQCIRAASEIAYAYRYSINFSIGLRYKYGLFFQNHHIWNRVHRRVVESSFLFKNWNYQCCLFNNSIICYEFSFFFKWFRTSWITK